MISEKIGFNEKAKIRIRIFDEIEEQKLDLIIKKNYDDAFVRMIEPDLQIL